MFRMTVPKNINLKFNSCEDDIFVKADMGQIQQVVMNLLINASEAFDGSNGTIEIGAGAPNTVANQFFIEVIYRKDSILI